MNKKIESIEKLKKIKHSGEPWISVLGSGQNVCSGIAREMPDGEMMIADVCPDYFLEKGYAPSLEESCQNLALIEIAPRMRAAILAAVKKLTERSSTKEDALNAIVQELEKEVEPTK